MSKQRTTVLVVGATGSIGHLVVKEATRKGHTVRALARDPGRTRRLFPDAEIVVGDLTRPDTVKAAVNGVDAIVFTHGSDGGGKTPPKASTTAACATCSPRRTADRSVSR
jgi:uncharacterized protein YbjT (DUF2867 family)